METTGEDETNTNNEKVEGGKTIIDKVAQEKADKAKASSTGTTKNTNIKTHKLIDQALHYDICLKVSHNDVSFSEIKNHHEYIFKNNIISWICFYSFIGSALFNKYLRKLNRKKLLAQ